MPYLKEICIAGVTLEVRKYHTIRYNCKGEKRAARSGKTCECQRKVNERKAVRTLTRKMNANFTDNTGMLATLTYLPAKRPQGSDEMVKDMRRFLVKLRKLFKKSGMELRYIYTKELGKHGAAHIHILMSICDITWLTQCWGNGGVDISPLYSKGEYSHIAKYFVKYATKTEETEGKLIGKRWYSSRNLREPIIIKKVVRADTFNRRIAEYDDYVLDPNSVEDFYDDFGYRHFCYRMIQVAPAQRKGG